MIITFCYFINCSRPWHWNKSHFIFRSNKYFYDYLYNITWFACCCENSRTPINQRILRIVRILRNLRITYKNSGILRNLRNPWILGNLRILRTLIILRHLRIIRNLTICKVFYYFFSFYYFEGFYLLALFPPFFSPIVPLFTICPVFTLFVLFVVCFVFPVFFWFESYSFENNQQTH